VAQYDRKQPLVIDPVLVYSTYLGGSYNEEGLAIAVDGSGNAYVTGWTTSTDFPKVNAKYPNLWGPRDAFVFKLSDDGQTVRYSTYLGGSSEDIGWGIAVDGSGNAYVTGDTLSTDFPKVNAKYPNLLGPSDAFVFKLSGDGQIVRYSTYLGGSSEDRSLGIAVDGSGNAYATGWTTSIDFPKPNALYPDLWGPRDAFIFKIADSIYPIYPDLCSIITKSGVKNRLALIVHGWNSNSEDWPTTIADMIRDRIPYEPGIKWHICAYDWRDGAGYGCDSDLNPLPGCFSPWDAYINALTIGQALGEKLATLNLDHIRLVHQ
jgi:hypothetical protein